MPKWRGSFCVCPSYDLYNTVLLYFGLNSGTGYYYERFRPGLGSVLVFLALLTSGVQYGVARINRQRDVTRIERLSKQAKVIAYGPKGVPLEKGIKRKVRVPVSGADASDEGAKGGRTLDLVVDGTDVYFVSLPTISSVMY